MRRPGSARIRPAGLTGRPRGCPSRMALPGPHSRRTARGTCPDVGQKAKARVGQASRTVWGQSPGPRAPVGQVPAYPAHRGADPGPPSPAWAAPVSPDRAVALRLHGNAGGGSDVTSRAVGPGRRVPVFQGGAGTARIRRTGRDGRGGWRGPPPSRR